ncbi:glycosyltransferase [Prosthecobacter sp.]|uniref:glycosyltransferase n=1 Tax=Prosthecobacter sp. TaxID=1965333 RepID=UPI0037841AB6
MVFTLFILIALIVYVQAGYMAVMGLLARFFPRRVEVQATQPMPAAISIILCVHNGAALIAQRLRNLAACHWSGELEILLYCDGCDDDTALRAAASNVRGLRILHGEMKRGKWAALNAGVQAARHPILVFADLRQTFELSALQELAAAFQDPAVGAVSGLLEIAESAGGGGRGLDLYWRMERRLRTWEARFDSVIGCTGAIYAMRREACRALAPGTILDDVIMPMQAAVQGWRVAYRPRAVAYDPQMLDPAKEKARKLRTLVGNYQMLESHPEWLLPWRNRLWWQLISHKYARLLVPWCLVAVLVLTLLSPWTPLVLLLLGSQVLCYALALLGALLPGCRSKLLTIPSGFLLLQAACASALWAYLRCRRHPLSLWKTPQSPAQTAA